MKIWVDDIREAPAGYERAYSVNHAKNLIMNAEFQGETVTLLDLDHDAGSYAFDGGDYIKLLDWMEENQLSYPIRIHTMNPVGRENMRAIIERNGWLLVI